MVPPDADVLIEIFDMDFKRGGEDALRAIENTRGDVATISLNLHELLDCLLIPNVIDFTDEDAAISARLGRDM